MYEAPEAHVLHGIWPEAKIKLFVAGVSILLTSCGSNRPFDPDCVGDECGNDPVCGNDHREAGEECDTTDVADNRCDTLGFDGGVLLCAVDCTFDATGCCLNACSTEGASQCAADRLESCTLGTNHCLGWVTVTNCALANSTCVENGTAACVPTGCSDNCTASGDTHCNGDAVEMCSLSADGCRDWVAAGDCAASDRICDDSGDVAVCVRSCEDGCSGAGNTRCNASAVESCETGDDGCLAWDEVVDCADAGQVCDEGTGTPQCDDTCTDGCNPSGVTRCLSDLLQVCATQPSGCLGWQSHTDCAADGLACAALPAPAACVAPVTTVRVHFDTGYGNWVSLRGVGAGLSWSSGVTCVWADGNIWEGALPGLLVGDEFKPLVNDEIWAPGTNYLVTEVGIMDVYPFFYGSTGRTELWASYHSEILDNDRAVIVYLPVSYDENPAKAYPILFMHDGQNVFDASTSFLGIEWQVDEALNNLSTQGGIRETIVVAPYNAGEDRTYEYTPTFDADVGDGGGGDLYLDFLLTELLPDIRAAYRTTGDRVGMAGSSLGGLITLYGCWTRPTELDICGVLSPTLWWDQGALPLMVNEHTGAKPDLVIYLDSGDTGPGQDEMVATAMMRDLLIEKGFVLDEDLKYVLGEGHEHNEAAWALRTPGAMEFLLDDPQRVDP